MDSLHNFIDHKRREADSGYFDKGMRHAYDFWLLLQAVKRYIRSIPRLEDELSHK